MEWLIIVGVLVVGAWLWLNSKAKGITRRHAETLSQRTGMPAERIYREIREGNLTPGEWASRHGLDPMSFQPGQPSDEVRQHAERELERLWRRLRLDPEAPPPGPATLERIGALHSELAVNLLEPAPMLAEVERGNEIAVELHALGSRVDAEWVNATIDEAREEMEGSRYSEESVLGRPQSQDDFDDWQQRQVERAASSDEPENEPPTDRHLP